VWFLIFFGRSQSLNACWVELNTFVSRSPAIQSPPLCFSLFFLLPSAIGTLPSLIEYECLSHAVNRFTPPRLHWVFCPFFLFKTVCFCNSLGPDSLGRKTSAFFLTLLLLSPNARPGTRHHQIQLSSQGSDFFVRPSKVWHGDLTVQSLSCISSFLRKADEVGF